MRILHFSDLHIGVENYGQTDPETGLSTRLADFLSSLDEVVEYALTEDLQYDDGHVTTLSMGEYKIPTMPDMPELRTVLVQSESGGPTPYGGKSIGEQGISSVAPAIVNAILDATGVAMMEIPVSSEKLFRAMQIQK